jgi:hypothetical protein
MKSDRTIFFPRLFLILLILIVSNTCQEKPNAPSFKNFFDPDGDYDDIPPLAVFSVSQDSGIANETTFIFDATGSFEEDSPHLPILFRWDFEGDSIYDTEWTTEKIISHIYIGAGGLKKVRLQVQGAKYLKSEAENEIYIIETNFSGTLDGKLTFSGTIQLNWNIDTENYKYASLEKKTGSDENFVKLIDFDPSVTAYTDEDIELCTQYSYRIRIVNERDSIFYLNPIIVNVEKSFESRIESDGDEYAIGILKTTDDRFLSYGNSIISTSQSIVKMVDNQGTVLWEKTFETGSKEECTSGVYLKDGNFIICSRYTYENSWFNCNSTLRKIDQQGNLIWAKVFDGDRGIVIQSIKETNDYNLVLGGSINGGIGTSWLTKTDEYGNPIWSKTIEKTEEIFSVVILEDNDILITGHSADESGSALGYTLIAKINTQGNIIWRKYYSYQPIISTIQNSENSYISVTSNSSNPYLMSVRILNYNQNGTIFWVHEIPGRTFSRLYPIEIIKTQDGQFLFSALIKETQDGILMNYLRKIDQAGNTVWEKSFNNSRSFSIPRNNICIDNSGDLIILSTSHSNNDILLNDFLMQIVVDSYPFCG